MVSRTRIAPLLRLLPRALVSPERALPLTAAILMSLALGPRAGAETVWELSGALGAGLDADLNHDFPRDLGGAVAIATNARFRRAWAFADAGVATAASDRGRDPTFDLGNARYTLVPIVFGLRTNLENPKVAGRSRFDLGLGVVLAPTWWRDLVGRRRSEFTWGVAVDAGPGIQVLPSWGLWMRGRLLVLASQRYGDVGSVNLSRGEIRLGVWRGRGARLL